MLYPCYSPLGTAELILPQILCQGRKDNPVHEVAFNELIENLKEKNTTWSNTMLDCERSVSRTLFMDENSDRSH